MERSSVGKNNTNGSTQAGNFSDSITSFDADSIRGVIQAGLSGLEIASTAPFANWLPYTPTRTRMLIISLSVFLLKATVIGGQDVDAGTVIEMLDRFQAALKANCLDDIDFASQYADLIRKYTVHLQQNLGLNHTQSGGGPTSHTIEMLRNGFAWPANTQDFQQSDAIRGATACGGVGDASVQPVAGGAEFMSQPFDGAADSSMKFLDLGWDNMAFGFEADSLDFLWAPNEQDTLDVAADYPIGL